MTGSLLPGLPVLLVVALSGLALASALTPAAGAITKRMRAVAIAVLGILAVATTVWQARASGEQIARLKQNDKSKELASQIRSLEDQVAKLKESTRLRSLGTDTASKLADYLRPFGSHKVVVSSIPNDIEAYRYATEIADALKAAQWDARGPETTGIFGDIHAMGINIYDNAGQGSDTAKVLIGALTKFGLPYQSRVPPTEALQSGTVELFIGTKPGHSTLAQTEAVH